MSEVKSSVMLPILIRLYGVPLNTRQVDAILVVLYFGDELHGPETSSRIL